MKQIAYLIVDNGEDGRGPTTINAAYWDEQPRNEAFERSKNKAYQSKTDQIVDIETATANAKAKLSGLERLLLGFSGDLR